MGVKVQLALIRCWAYYSFYLYIIGEMLRKSTLERLDLGFFLWREKSDF